MSNPNQYPGHPAYGRPGISYPGQYPPVAPSQYPPNPVQGYNQYPPTQYAYPPQAYAPSSYSYPGQAPPYGAPLIYSQPPQPYPPSQQPFYPPQPIQNNHPPVATSNRPAFEPWYPNAAELQQIDLWLQEVDPERTGLAPGATVAPLLKRSNLQKETLKELWQLVDWNRQGSLDREQFTIAIRFLCILCNPICMGSKPTVELFNQTVSKDLSIPSQMLKQEEPVALVTSLSRESSSGLPSPINISLGQPQYTAAYPVNNSYASYPPPLPIMPSYQPSPYKQHSPLPPHHQQQHQPPSPLQPHIIQASVVVEEDEEFSDFTGASHEPSAQQHTEESEASWDFVAAATPIVQEPSTVNLSNISSLLDFDLLGSPSPAARNVDKDEGSSVKDEKSPPLVAEKEEEEDEFGDADFQQATLPPLTQQQAELNLPLLDRPSQVAPEQVQVQPIAPPQQLPTLLSMTSMALASKLSAFDELVEQDLMTAAVEGEDWDDFADASEIAPPSSQLAAEASPIMQQNFINESSDNPFDDIEDVTPLALVQNASLHVTTAVVEDTEDEIGDFESNHSPLPDHTNHPVTQLPVVTSPVDAVQFQQDVKIAMTEDDEFGDFEEHTESPVPNHQTPITPQVYLFPSPSLGTEPSANQIMAPAMIEDLLDLLSDPLPMANHIANNGGLGLPPAKRSSTDFLDLLNSPELVVAPVANMMMSPQQHQAQEEDDEDESFGDFNSAAAAFTTSSALPPALSHHNAVVTPRQDNIPTENLSFDVDFDAEFEPFQSSSAPPPTAKEIGEDAVSLPSPIDQARLPAVAALPAAVQVTSIAPHRASNPEVKPLSMKELESLVVQLVNKDLYDEAYACARQITLLKQMQELIELKNTALERDDMEAANKIKKQTTDLLPLIEQQDEEQVWKEAAENKKRQGQRLGDMYENLSLFDEALARKFKAKYMNASSIATKNAPLEIRMRFHALAKRSSRILLAVSSSHRNHPSIWKQLIDNILPFLVEHKRVMSAFQQFSAKEKSFVKASSKFQGYLQSFVALLEGGVWLAASCQEALVLESESNHLYESCQSLLMVIAKDCGAKSQLMGKTIEELSLQAGKVSERTGVIYCNLTFRPLALTSSITGEKKDLCPYIGKNQGVHYQLALMNLWLQSITATFPISDGEFA